MVQTYRPFQVPETDFVRWFERDQRVKARPDLLYVSFFCRPGSSMPESCESINVDMPWTYMAPCVRVPPAITPTFTVVPLA